MTIPCCTPGCPHPSLVICEACARQLCGVHYGAGSSARCGECFQALVRETSGYFVKGEA